MTWRVIDSDTEFQNIFTGTVILRATGDGPPDAPGGDVFWYLADGRIVAMETYTDGYESCGYSTVKVYYLFQP